MVRRGGRTLEANVAAINVKTLQLAYEVDPLFKKTSAAFDEAGARGLLLNNLQVFFAHIHITFLCNVFIFTVCSGSISALEPSMIIVTCHRCTKVAISFLIRATQLQAALLALRHLEPQRVWTLPLPITFTTYLMHQIPSIGLS